MEDSQIVNEKMELSWSLLLCLLPPLITDFFSTLEVKIKSTIY